MKTLALLWALLTGGPVEASGAAARLIGHPELVEFLAVVAQLEGRGGSPGLHPQDAHLGPRMHAAALRVGWLSWWCPLHWSPAAGWSPRGPLGAAPANTARHFGKLLGCIVPAGAHDIAAIAALAGALHAAHCARVRGRSYRAMRLCWAGGHKDPEAVMARFDAALVRYRRAHRRSAQRP
jgi:hypothetical protein